jgi:transcriptional regulator with XRE-family HTH domain
MAAASRCRLLEVPKRSLHNGRMSDWIRAGQAAAARRGELELTQAELAARAGVDAKTIYNLEAGGRKPIARSRARIETALGWPSGHLEQLARGPEPEPGPRRTATENEAADELERHAAQLLDAARRIRGGQQNRLDPNGKANGDDTRRTGLSA